MSCAGTGPEGDPSRPGQDIGPGVSWATGELGHGVAVPAGNTSKGGSTTGSVGNTEERSSSEVEAGVVVVENVKTDSSNTTWQEMRTRRELRS